MSRRKRNIQAEEAFIWREDVNSAETEVVAVDRGFSERNKKDEYLLIKLHWLKRILILTMKVYTRNSTTIMWLLHIVVFFILLETNQQDKLFVFITQLITSETQA